jgi:hypothetical protein
MAQIVDISAQVFDLAAIILRRAAAADATLAGFFVDKDGRHVYSGTSYSVTMTIGATAQTLAEALGTSLPTGAAGFIGRLTVADVIISSGAGSAGVAAIKTDMAATPARYPLIAQTDDIRLGRA